MNPQCFAIYFVKIFMKKSKNNVELEIKTVLN